MLIDLFCSEFIESDEILFYVIVVPNVLFLGGLSLSIKSDEILFGVHVVPDVLFLRGFLQIFFFQLLFGKFVLYIEFGMTQL